VAAGAVGAVGALGGVALVMSFVDSGETGIKEEPLPVPDDATFNPTDVQQASKVTDDMTFAEAFAAARKETGSGGIFFWKGGCYGTYYKTEWEQLPNDYKKAYSNYPYPKPETATVAETAQEETTAMATATTEDSETRDEAAATDDSESSTDETVRPNETVEEETDEQPHDDAEVTEEGYYSSDEIYQDDGLIKDEQPTTDEVSDAPGAEVFFDEIPAAEQTSPDPLLTDIDLREILDSKVEFLGVKYGTIDEQQVAYALHNIEGQQCLLIDTDTDGIFDKAYTVDAMEGEDISALHITHDQILSPETDSMDLQPSNILPDYTNNASPEEFITA